MSPERKLRTRMIVTLIVILILAGIAGWLLLRFAIPQYYFRWYPAIPLYFIVLSIVMAVEMRHQSKRRPAKILTVLMIMRVIKLLLTIGTLLLYYWLVDEQMVAVALTMLAFYFLHLFVETYLFYRFEKQTKQIR